MDELQGSMAVLAKAVHYKNLTGASLHIGLSQPQISRHIARLEEELQITLLDRSSKRKSVWTQSAHELAAIIDRSRQKLQHSIQELQLDSQPTQLHIGTLEGLAPLASQFANLVLKNTSTRFVQIDVYDQNEIEALFTTHKIDVAFTSRIPSKQKLKYSHKLGLQVFDTYDSDKSLDVYSPFEYAQKKKNTKNNKTLVSNSLSIRRAWLDTYGGRGQVPGVIGSKGELPVLMIANDILNPIIWEQTKNL